MLLVEHHAEQVLAIVDRAYVLVNGRVAWEGEAATLAGDEALQARLLGLVEHEESVPAAPDSPASPAPAPVPA
jgi:ABC-type lipopolysaccharide export system ATPase subunit